MWVKLDDRFPRHPKVVGLSDAAFRLHVTGLCYCAEHLTDGRITSSACRLLGASRRQLDELVGAGLWVEDGEAWFVHDFLEYNPSKAKVQRERADAAERKRRWNAERNASRDASRTENAHPPRTRPVPKGLGTGGSSTSAVAAAPQPSAGAATPDTKLDEQQKAVNSSGIAAAKAQLRKPA